MTQASATNVSSEATDRSALRSIGSRASRKLTGPGRVFLRDSVETTNAATGPGPAIGKGQAVQLRPLNCGSHLQGERNVTSTGRPMILPRRGPVSDAARCHPSVTESSLTCTSQGYAKYVRSMITNTLKDGNLLHCRLYACLVGHYDLDLEGRTGPRRYHPVSGPAIWSEPGELGRRLAHLIVTLQCAT